MENKAGRGAENAVDFTAARWRLDEACNWT